ncbi:MAG: hypothetical protein HPY64_08175 [Anaerolineae bacterium]|nr:hypothetical protein [Anaerolineae bacterium]
MLRRAVLQLPFGALMSPPPRLVKPRIIAVTRTQPGASSGDWRAAQPVCEPTIIIWLLFGLIVHRPADRPDLGQE